MVLETHEKQVNLKLAFFHKEKCDGENKGHVGSCCVDGGESCIRKQLWELQGGDGLGDGLAGSQSLASVDPGEVTNCVEGLVD